MTVDFTDTKIYPSIREKITTIPGRIAVLINNVGMMNSLPQEFADENNNPDFNNQMIICNIFPVVNMCEIVLPTMKKQKFGIVVNISSIFAELAYPYFAVYGSTKHFVTAFTTSVSIEYKEYGIVFQDLTPGQVKTNLSKDVANGLVAVSAPSFVASALNAIGKEFHTNAHIKHKMMNGFAKFFRFWLPEAIRDPIAKAMVKSMDKKKKDSSKIHP